MIDPYGEDLEDLSVILYVESTLEICSTIMNSKNRRAKLGGGARGLGRIEEKKSIDENWSENGER